MLSGFQGRVETGSVFMRSFQMTGQLRLTWSGRRVGQDSESLLEVNTGKDLVVELGSNKKKQECEKGKR